MMRWLSKRQNFLRGFTLVEIIVVLVAITILMTITLVIYSSQQKQGRDAQRSSKVTILAEALEKYYDKNGEYPSCGALTGNPTAVTTNVLQGIELSVLVAPKDTGGTGNSLKCTDLTALSQPDYFAYVGDSSVNCQTGNACLMFTLKYQNEASNKIVSVESRHKVDFRTSGTPTIAAVVASFSQINLTWDSISNATSYTLERATDSGFTQNYSSQSYTGTTASITGLSINTGYYFRVKAVSASGDGSWSNVATGTTWNLAAPVIAANAASLTSFTGTWGAITHASGYVAQCSTDGVTWGAACQTGTLSTTSYTFGSAAPNTRYYVRVMATNGSYTSPWSNVANTVTWNLTAPTIAGSPASSTSFTATWNTTSYATGYVVQCSPDGSSWGSFCQTGAVPGTSYTFYSATQGWQYYIRVQSVNGAYSSPWSNVATLITPIDAPAPYNINIGDMAWNNIRGSASNAVCPANTTPSYDWYHNVNGNNSFWVSGTQYQIVDYNAVNVGVSVSLTVATRCLSSFTASGFTWANGAASKSIANPGVWAQATPNNGYRDAAWGGSCPAYTSSVLYDARMHGTGGIGDVILANVTQTYYKNASVSWGNGTVRAAVKCYGPWGEARADSAPSEFGPACIPTITIAQCTW